MGYLAGDAKILIVGGIFGWLMPIPFFLGVAIYLYAEAKSVDTGVYAKTAKDWILAKGLAYYMPKIFSPRPSESATGVPPMSGSPEAAFEDIWPPQDVPQRVALP